MGPNSGTQWSLLIVLAKEMTDMCVPYRQTAGLLLPLDLAACLHIALIASHRSSSSYVDLQLSCKRRYEHSYSPWSTNTSTPAVQVYVRALWSRFLTHNSTLLWTA